MSGAELAGMDRATVESMLGRRLRPWWGTSPLKLLLRGAVQGAVFALVIYGALQVRAGDLDLTGSGLEDKRDLIDRVALIVAVVAGLGVVYGVVRVVVGVLDLLTRESVQGTVIRADERRTGDWLPEPIQWLWYRRGNRTEHYRDLNRRTRYEVVLATADGQKAWNVSLRLFPKARPGEVVQLKVSPLLGHVSAIDPVAIPD